MQAYLYFAMTLGFNGEMSEWMTWRRNIDHEPKFVLGPKLFLLPSEGLKGMKNRRILLVVIYVVDWNNENPCWQNLSESLDGALDCHSVTLDEGLPHQRTFMLVHRPAI